MTKKQDTLSFISQISREAVKRELENHTTKLEHIRKTLATGVQGIEDARTFQKRGTDWQRKEVMTQCEAWMNSTNCPDYLRDEYRQKAYHSCDNDYIEKVRSAMHGLKLDLTNDVEVAPDGKWIVKQSVIDAKLEACRYTLTPEEVEAYRIYEQIIDLAEELHKRRYFIASEFGSEEDNLYRLDNQEHQLEHFLSLYVMTDAERKERLKKIGY